MGQEHWSQQSWRRFESEGREETLAGRDASLGPMTGPALGAHGASFGPEALPLGKGGAGSGGGAPSCR